MEDPKRRHHDCFNVVMVIHDWMIWGYPHWEILGMNCMVCTEDSPKVRGFGMAKYAVALLRLAQ